MYIELSPMSTRNQFGAMLGSLRLPPDAAGFNHAVEVGTHRGYFAKPFLTGWRGEKRLFYAVDPWSIPSGYESQLAGLRVLGSTGDRDDDFHAAKSYLAKFSPRVMYIRQHSEEAVKGFGDGTLDFVYIDGDHRYEEVVKDLASWWPKVRNGGILAGHDFLCPGEKNGGWGRGIQKAVDEFAAEISDPTVYVIAEENNLPWSFYIIKE